jgi:hypothetical protein
MKNNFIKLILSSGILLIGILGSLVVKYFPPNILGIILLVILGIFRFGGLILFINYLIKFFSKEKIETEILEEHIIVKRNKLLVFSSLYLILGVFSCSSSFLIKYICNSSERICNIQSLGVSLLFFIPIGIILISIGILKFYKFFKK